MRPPQIINQQYVMAAKKGVVTRSQNSANTSKYEGNRQELPKRKAEFSPPKNKTLKRSALGDISNAFGGVIQQDSKKFPRKVTASKPVLKSKDKGVVKVPVVVPPKIPVMRPTLRTHTILNKLPVSTKPKVIKVQKSQEINTKSGTSVPAKEIKEDICVVLELQQNSASIKDSSSDSSLYVSALEDIPSEGSYSQGEPQVLTLPTTEPNPSLEITELKSNPVFGLPEGVVDFDKGTLNDPYQVSLYAMDIFNYLKEREVIFKVDNYIEKQPSISQWMRSLLIDWMVEVQETFELNHETLYLAVNLVDLYLAKIVIKKETLQLIGAAAIFIASKFDERMPPLVEDFLYICDGAYTHRELIQMEINVLRIVDFDLGIPLSYRFLRRYARCAKLSLPTLTLARYILELSLMEYSFVSESPSKMAAAALLLALKTKLLADWTPTLQYYSGYKLEDIKHLAHRLNVMLHQKPRAALATIRTKYSHRIFFEVAKIPLLEKLHI